MSGSAVAFNVINSILTVGDYISNILMRRPRLLDVLIPDCAVQEVHHDKLTITDHPVEFGADITDHAFKNPVVVNLQYAWSNSSSFTNSETYDQQVYAALLSIQASRTPFTIITGKRAYQNMLMEEISVTVDETSEYALMTNIVCREVIIVSTSSVSLPSSPISNQAAPQTTAPTASTGQQQAAPVTSPPNAVGNVIT